MLTLGRKSGESVLINGNITVTAHTETGSNKIRLVFDAPKSVSITCAVRNVVHFRKQRLTEICHLSLEL
jgi:carbon storage regulator CsrA